MSAINDTLAAEVHRRALENITNEMAITLRRTSGSPVVTEASDFQACVFDAIPEHLGSAAFVQAHLGSSLVGTQAVAATAAELGDLAPGDGWIVNDPHVGGALHQADVGIIMPVFTGDTHQGWTFTNIHVLDIGGSGVSGIAPGALNIFGEGLRFPPIRVIRGGLLDPEWEKFIAANVRAPRPVINDIRSMIAASHVGASKLNEVIERFGIDAHLAYSEHNKDLTEKTFRERISSMPDGVYEAVDWVEWDGRADPDVMLPIQGRLAIDGSDLVFSFEGFPQIEAYVNAGRGAMIGSIAAPLVVLLGYGDFPINGGMWRPLSFDFGEPGTNVNPTMPAAVSFGHVETGFAVRKLTASLLIQACSLSDDPVLRSRVAGIAHNGHSSNALSGTHDAGHQSTIFYMDDAIGTGGGAQTNHDGQDVHGGTGQLAARIPELEVYEHDGPTRFLWKRIAPNSGGPGAMRGGQGMEEAYEIAHAEKLRGPAWNNVAHQPACGPGGGFPGAASAARVIRSAGVRELLDHGIAPSEEARLTGETEYYRKKMSDLVVERGDVVIHAGGGGSGLGDPLLRSPEIVAEDVQAGWITRKHAEAAYAVILTETGMVDPDATASAREELRRRRIGAEPRAELRAPSNIGISIGVADGTWRCESCLQVLGPISRNWRDGATMQVQEIAARYEELDMAVAPRTTSPEVLMREYYCPSCAAALEVDVVTADWPTLAAPVLTSEERVA
ncbi:hydantoinase B/oxoprolinase family protein [Microcella sp.]|uniref:hydantoinase B/oxoprolinase family protein n=1 Tax=Microcella sp. TaxID=1913979 RepID=UPI002567FBE7|nr:hydantoinase B/oxoprolinase family protein [Microcella sp.]MBX9472394.1 hydantoinase B/oxoprolinase family protein [Microcella sp.]